MNAAPGLYWIDLLWLPSAFFITARGKRLLTAGFIVSCMILLRLQVELLAEGGFPNGIMGFMESGILARGMMTYGVFIALFLLISRLSPGVDKSIHIAASISVFFAAFCVSTLIMVL